MRKKWNYLNDYTLLISYFLILVFGLLAAQWALLSVAAFINQGWKEAPVIFGATIFFAAGLAAAVFWKEKLKRTRISNAEEQLEQLQEVKAGRKSHE